MKACAGWRWSNTAMCSSMLLVSTNADCFDTSCRPSVAIEQIGCAHAKLKADIQLLFLGEVSMAESVWIRRRLVISGAKEDNWRLGKNKQKKPHTQGLMVRSAVTCKTDHDGAVYTKNSSGTC